MAEPETEAPPKTEEKETRAPATREWEPFQTLRREIDRVFENFHEGPWRSTFGRARIDFEPFRLLTGSWGSAPPVNIVAELPGMDESNVELKVGNGVLTLKGEKKAEKEEKTEDYVLSERRFGSVQRSIPLPDDVDLNKIEATFKKGVLIVTMPKTPEAEKSEKKIAIKAG